MVYKEKDGYFYQLAYGDCLKKWFLNCGKIGKHKLSDHLIKEEFKTKAEGMKRFNEVFKQGFANCETGEGDRHGLQCSENKKDKERFFKFEFDENQLIEYLFKFAEYREGLNTLTQEDKQLIASYVMHKTI